MSILVAMPVMLVRLQSGTVLTLTSPASLIAGPLMPLVIRSRYAPRQYSAVSLVWIAPLRPLKRATQQQVVQLLAMRLLRGEFRDGDAILADAAEGHLTFRRAEALTAAS